MEGRLGTVGGNHPQRVGHEGDRGGKQAGKTSPSKLCQYHRCCEYGCALFSEWLLKRFYSSLGVFKFIQVLGSVTIPATTTAPAKKYTNVLNLNNAGSNRLLFACPSTQALLSWAAALRLAAWEKSRLEEIYSAHLIRITLTEGQCGD